VRQGGVLSPVLFAIFIDSVVDKVKSTGLGCYFFSVCVSIFLYVVQWLGVELCKLSLQASKIHFCIHKM